MNDTVIDPRGATHPALVKTLGSAALRKQFLVENVFVRGTVSATYSNEDRMIFGGIMPESGPLTLPRALSEACGTAYFLQRRELGLLNLGGPAAVDVDGRRFEIGEYDALYVGAGAREVLFSSEDPGRPAKLYYVSATAHRSFRTRKVARDEASSARRGDQKNSNCRTVLRYLAPEILPTCQLLMGIVALEEGNVWSPLPTHRHGRRSEVYLHYGLEPEAAVIFLLGEPDETRHLIVRDEQAVIVPGWAVHAGVGTSSHGVVWAMAGENLEIGDMDFVPTSRLR
ncbi:5-dehydro-4-deoxy-D-glucuronate isomerase [Paraburkholderia sp. NMBU_R16]|uniref:5-dehydro-4-deoxy-D-glucuronate isomerase n=1 Tax=Paraburkholderia sp. NMBU_R16 TaxID=2698676 RepID=UPI001567B0C4|nr:5-dehydro-4-deoxy-D-glucuronate isomerase [Paraburkholderia sp. NMBU_R16]NRO98724.1 5-dehydro-4-deoxy-D-glucuronate isomerase [Paraburkholderia sp. NMBU_R16]